jgi:hypothetical protein
LLVAALVPCGVRPLRSSWSLPADGGAEDVVGFEKGGEGIEDEHDAGGPVEDLQRQGGGEGGAGEGLGFAEDQAADERDAGGEGQEEERVENAVVEGLMRLDQELGVFEGEEDGVEDHEQGEKAKEKSYGFG